MTDQKDPKYKKYRIPSHNNPFYTKAMDNQNLREAGGEQDDRYQQLVLGRHGNAAFQLISRDDIVTATYPFNVYRYNGAQKLSGIKFEDVLQRPKLPELKAIVLAIDPGYVDPTVINLVGQDMKGIWKTYVRYTLTRIDFNEQTTIIDWLATHYGVGTVSIDVGAGGNGASILHNLVNDERYKTKNYASRVHGVQFAEKLVVGVDEQDQEMTLEAKSHAVNLLVKMIQDGELVFSEHDHEGMSQMERISKQKTLNGRDRFFILSDKGAGIDSNDHIFASYICFVLALDSGISTAAVVKLASPDGAYT